MNVNYAADNKMTDDCEIIGKCEEYSFKMYINDHYCII